MPGLSFPSCSTRIHLPSTPKCIGLCQRARKLDSRCGGTNLPRRDNSTRVLGSQAILGEIEGFEQHNVLVIELAQETLIPTFFCEIEPERAFLVDMKDFLATHLVLFFAWHFRKNAVSMKER